jgi:hypothetical protein
MVVAIVFLLLHSLAAGALPLGVTVLATDDFQPSVNLARWKAGRFSLPREGGGTRVSRRHHLEQASHTEWDQ